MILNLTHCYLGITILPDNTSHIVEWTDGFDRGKPITWYKLEVQKVDGRQIWETLKERINKTDVKVVERQSNDNDIFNSYL